MIFFVLNVTFALHFAVNSSKLSFKRRLEASASGKLKKEMNLLCRPHYFYHFLAYVTIRMDKQEEKLKKFPYKLDYNIVFKYCRLVKRGNN